MIDDSPENSPFWLVRIVLGRYRRHQWKVSVGVGLIWNDKCLVVVWVCNRVCVAMNGELELVFNAGRIRQDPFSAAIVYPTLLYYGEAMG